MNNNIYDSDTATFSREPKAHRKTDTGTRKRDSVTQHCSPSGTETLGRSKGKSLSASGPAPAPSYRCVDTRAWMECEANYDWRVTIKFRVCVIMLSNMFISRYTFPPARWNRAGPRLGEFKACPAVTESCSFTVGQLLA